MPPGPKAIDHHLFSRGKNAWGWTVFEVGGRKLDSGTVKGPRETAERAALEAKAKAEAARRGG